MFFQNFGRNCLQSTLQTINSNNIVYKKNSFGKGHSAEHAILQLVDQVSTSLEKKLFTLVVFIYLSKAFDAVDYSILICKLKNCGIRGNNLKVV